MAMVILFVGIIAILGRNSSIQVGENHTVTIGLKTSISHNVRIYTNSADVDQDFMLKRSDSFKEVSGDVKIGNNVWVGANIAVNRSLPSHSICAGIPVKVIKF